MKTNLCGKEEEHFIEWGDRRVPVSAAQKAKWDAWLDYWDALAAKVELHEKKDDC